MMTSAMGWGMMITGLPLLIGALTLVVLGAAWLTGAVGRSKVLHHRYAQALIGDDELGQGLSQVPIKRHRSGGPRTSGGRCAVGTTTAT